MSERTLSVTLLFTEGIVTFLLCTIIGFSIPISLKTSLLWIIIMSLINHYKIKSSLIWDDLIHMLKAVLSFSILVIILIYPHWIFSFKIIAVIIVVFIISILINILCRIFFRHLIGRRTLIIGIGDEALRIAKIANTNNYAITRVLAMVSEDENINNFDKSKYQINNIKLYKYSELNKAINELQINQVIIAMPNTSNSCIEEVLNTLSDKVKEVKILPNTNNSIRFNTIIEDFDGVLLISTSRYTSRIKRAIKRFIDVCAGITGCLLLIPLTLYVKIINIKNGDYEPIFFVQERIGYNGNPIKIYKYRSMIPNAEQVLITLMANNQSIRDEYLTNKKLVNDPRITKTGAFLRRTSLDEFPQFINVLKGEMSLVGPRPYLPREREDIGLYYDSIIQCKPGITGMWQANGRSDVGFKERCRLDDYYYRNWSIKLDLILIYKTIKGVLFGKGAL